MITISFLGLDQYLVGKYSAEHTKNLADLFEADRAAINFYAPNCYFYHEGVDQTAWNTLIRVHAPKQYAPLEEKVAKYLLETTAEIAINVAVEFCYYDQKARHELLNDDYPRFITEANAVHVHDEEGEDESEELFEGDIFAGIEGKDE